jgi:RNase H-fold protein (predicted Holliday junction resolvase)
VLTVPNTRTVRATSTTISFQGVTSDGDAADPGTVTVGVTRSDGTEVVAAGTATSGSSTSPRTYTLTPTDTASLDVLTATWTASGVVVGITTHEIVERVYTSTADIRSTDTSLADAAKYPATLIRSVASQVEQTFEHACGVGFVPRFSSCRLDGNGLVQISLPFAELRRVRWARIWTDGDSYDELTATELAAIPANHAGIAVRTDGNTWPVGQHNIEIGFEHGYDAVPLDIKQAHVRAARRKLNEFRSAVPDQAVSMQLAEGGSIVFAAAGVGDRVFGIPDVDEVLKRHNRRVVGIA